MSLKREDGCFFVWTDIGKLVAYRSVFLRESHSVLLKSPFKKGKLIRREE